MKLKTFLSFSFPSNIIMVALMIVPFFMAIWLGMNYITFTNVTAPVFIGLTNYKEILADPRFHQALWWTMIIVVVTVPMHIIIAFVLALLLDQVSSWIRLIFFSGMLLPMIVVPVIGTIVFKQLFDPSGLLAWAYNAILGNRFIFTETSMKAIILLHTIWQITPYALVVFFAGLQTLPQEQIEAAAIDGANRLQQVRYITIPHLRALFVLNGLMAIMDMFRIFDNIFVFTSGNPVYNADTVMMYDFRTAIYFSDLGKGNAISVLAVILIMVMLIPLLYYTYREQIEGH